jgi:hypothetical protein
MRTLKPCQLLVVPGCISTFRGLSSLFITLVGTGQYILLHTKQNSLVGQYLLPGTFLIGDMFVTHRKMHSKIMQCW